MINTIIRVFAGVLFAATGLLSLTYSRDYWQAASWVCFGLGFLIPVFPATTDEAKKRLRFISLVFLGIGVLILVLQLLNIIPTPFRPLSFI